MRYLRRGVTRRGIQVTLGLLWVLDGLLQLQPAMFTAKFATQVIAPAGAGQPAFVSWPIELASRVILHQPVVADLAFAVIQLALGAGLLYPRTARRALFASVAWALAVWYLGEGLGGLLGGGETLLTGAPGAALMYAIVAVAAAPPRADRTGAGAVTGTTGGRPARWTAAAWAAVWIGGAVLQVLPGSDTNDLLGMAVAMNATGAPGWLAAISNHLAALIPYRGISLVVDLVVLQAFAGVGILLPGRARRAAVWTGIGLSLAYWVVGQGLGQYWSGLATDPDTAPLLILLGAAVLGAVPGRLGRARPGLHHGKRGGGHDQGVLGDRDLRAGCGQYADAGLAQGQPDRLGAQVGRDPQPAAADQQPASVLVEVGGDPVQPRVG